MHFSSYCRDTESALVQFYFRCSWKTAVKEHKMKFCAEWEAWWGAVFLPSLNHISHAVSVNNFSERGIGVLQIKYLLALPFACCSSPGAQKPSHWADWKPLCESELLAWTQMTVSASERRYVFTFCGFIWMFFRVIVTMFPKCHIRVFSSGVPSRHVANA